MKCPACESEGERSTVYDPGGGVSTAMMSPSWWDEDGVYHHHDMNTFTQTFTCSRRHRWSVSTRSSCSAGDDPGETKVSPVEQMPEPSGSIWRLDPGSNEWTEERYGSES